jgi:hypothetical protein
MADWILKSTGAAPEAGMIAIEFPQGLVVESLMERGFQVYAINPKRLDRFRDGFSAAGAKDDSHDAEALADKPYGADERVIEPLRDAKIEPVIPSKANRKQPRPYDKDLYTAGRLIENFF